jgi:eukaryotic-like serine/threonine-protein kinase
MFGVPSVFPLLLPDTLTCRVVSVGIMRSTLRGSRIACRVGVETNFSTNWSCAIQRLQAAANVELSTEILFPGSTMYPVYLRGSAYLASRRGQEAAGEFQKFVDHRGLIVNCPLGALAHLGLARAYALSGETTKAKVAYQDFLALWKDADPDIPILIAAKSEYATLK